MSLRICDVCRLLDEDFSLKETTYCAGCGVNMCAPCHASLKRRATAMIRLASLKMGIRKAEA